MSEKNNGGPAFPTSRVNMNGEVVPDEVGMSLRDYFAAKAMTMTMMEFEQDWDAHAFEQPSFLDWAAERAYAIADAMLKVRQE